MDRFPLPRAWDSPGGVSSYLSNRNMRCDETGEVALATQGDGERRKRKVAFFQIHPSVYPSCTGVCWH